MSDIKKAASPKAIPKELPKVAPVAQETVVYVGPELPGVKRYTVYNNGLPKELKEQMEKQPVLKSLIVPIERLAKVNAELEREGSALHILYRRACGK